MDLGSGEPGNRRLNSSKVDAEAYDAPYAKREQAGENIHGEADFVESFEPRSVLDAGCGTGRVGIELARRGIHVIGVDIDPGMLQRARAKAPHLDWRLGDLARVDLGRKFDAIVMAGNVMIFLEPGSEGEVIRNMAKHLAPGGVLITGFQLAIGYLELEDYDRHATAAGLEITERWSTWHRDRWHGLSNYAVSVHRLATIGVENGA